MSEEEDKLVRIQRLLAELGLDASLKIEAEARARRVALVKDSLKADIAEAERLQAVADAAWQAITEKVKAANLSDADLTDLGLAASKKVAARRVTAGQGVRVEGVRITPREQAALAAITAGNVRLSAIHATVTKAMSKDWNMATTSDMLQTMERKGLIVHDRESRTYALSAPSAPVAQEPVEGPTQPAAQ